MGAKRFNENLRTGQGKIIPVKVGEKVKVIIPPDLGKHLNPFNIRPLNANACYLAAAGHDQDGNLKRAKEYIFFPQGTMTLLNDWQELVKKEQETHMISIGTLTKKQDKNKTAFWHLSFEEDPVLLKSAIGENGLMTIHVTEKEVYYARIILSQVKAHKGQCISLW